MACRKRQACQALDRSDVREHFAAPQVASRPTEELREGESAALDTKRYSVAKLRETIITRRPILERWGKPLNGRVRTWADLMFDESRWKSKAATQDWNRPCKAQR
jgi:hypothetical protein